MDGWSENNIIVLFLICESETSHYHNGSTSGVLALLIENSRVMRYNGLNIK